MAIATNWALPTKQKDLFSSQFAVSKVARNLQAPQNVLKFTA
jgi:hypothetical protein